MQNYNNNIKTNALIGLSNGVNICAQAVKGTIGKGSNVVIQKEEYPGYILTKDAYSIIQAIQCEDPLENQAVNMMKEATDSMNKRSKDGRTTMVLLTDAILQKTIELGFSPMETKSSLEEVMPLIESEIDKQKRPITSEDIEAVATTASDSERIGKLLGSIYKKIGKDGIINLEGSGTWEDEIKYIEGVRFQDVGFLSPAMVHDELAVKDNRKETKAVYENPIILVTKRKISHINDINPLLETLEKKGKKDLVIFTDDMDNDVARLLVELHKSHVFNILIIRAPVLWKNYVFEDFAKITGSTVVEDATGINFKNLEMKHLGTCGKITVDKEETIVTGIADISDHISDLKARGDNDSLLRLSWLTTKTAILRLGAVNEGELSLLRLKAEDAIHSSRLALIDGVIDGGGVTLNNISQMMPPTIGGKILSEALQVPMKQIMLNSNTTDVFSFTESLKNKVIDASIVTKNAVKNAISMACNILTVNTFVTLPKRTAEEIAAEALKAKGLRPF